MKVKGLKVMILLAVFMMLFPNQGFSKHRRGGGDKLLVATIGFYDVTKSPTLFGLTASFKTTMGDNMKIGGNLGYYWKSTKTIFGNFTYSVMPITGLFEYHFSGDDFSPYAGFDAGFYRTGFGGVSVTKFGAAPVLGFDYSLGNIGLNVNMKYNHIFVQGSEITSGALSLNAGVNFSF